VHAALKDVAYRFVVQQEIGQLHCSPHKVTTRDAAKKGCSQNPSPAGRRKVPIFERFDLPEMAFMKL
jgi:hypothetical protein